MCVRDDDQGDDGQSDDHSDGDGCVSVRHGDDDSCDCVKVLLNDNCLKKGTCQMDETCYKEILMGFVAQHGGALSSASNELKNDKEVVMAAVAQDSDAPITHPTSCKTTTSSENSRDGVTLPLHLVIV